MMPQSHLMVAAAVKAEREKELRRLLESMNQSPGVANPQNPLLPFGQFERLHFARLLILQDQTLDDVHTAYGLPRQRYPLMLAFIADFDGEPDDFRAQLAERAGAGLRSVFACCDGFRANTDLVHWMKDHEQPPAAAYVNWLGRTARHIHEDDALRRVLEAYFDENASALEGKSAREVRKLAQEFVEKERGAGRIRLTSEESTPFGWTVRRLFHLVAVPLVLLIFSPILLLYLPVFLYQLRQRERSDMEIAPRPHPCHEANLAQLEDNDITNQFSAMGSIKPGLFRRWTLRFLLWLVNYTARHFFIRGHLARVPTIHFARWVFLNDRKRLLFASNYDGSLESYMDDFINKVGWGLNLAFSNGIGYPRTRWLVLDGCKNEQKFKYFLRRHQLPTEVWYNSHPGLSAFDLKRNLLIRRGLEHDGMSEAELEQWLALF